MNYLRAFLICDTRVAPFILHILPFLFSFNLRNISRKRERDHLVSQTVALPSREREKEEKKMNNSAKTSTFFRRDYFYLNKLKKSDYN